MPEWLNGTVLKTVIRETVSGVRIPEPPQYFMIIQNEHFISDDENESLLKELEFRFSELVVEPEPFYFWVDLKNDTSITKNPLFLRVYNRLLQLVKKETGESLRMSYFGFAIQTKGFDYHADSVWPENASDRNLGTPQINENTYKNYSGLWIPNYVPDRKFTTVLYLNDNINGGETHFPTQQLLVKPQKNKVVGFECDENHVHGVMPTTQGVRKAFISWYEN